MQIQIVPALADNYIFMLLSDSTEDAAAVDPGDAAPVLQYLAKTGRRLTAILNTHHHQDHTGGNKALLSHFPRIPVYGGLGDRGRIPDQTGFLKEGDSITVCGRNAAILDVPGHTRCSMCVNPPASTRIMSGLQRGSKDSKLPRFCESQLFHFCSKRNVKPIHSFAGTTRI